MTPGIFTRLSSVGQASSLKTVHTGQLVNAALFERGLFARVTPLKPAGPKHSASVATNRIATILRALGSRHASQIPNGIQKIHNSGRSSDTMKPKMNAR